MKNAKTNLHGEESFYERFITWINSPRRKPNFTLLGLHLVASSANDYERPVEWQCIKIDDNCVTIEKMGSNFSIYHHLFHHNILY
jgi:hypothetical protein